MNADEKEYLIKYEKVYLSDYDINWETQFADEKKLLQSYFPDVFIEHIGSTSVKGMVAKPIIDIMLGIVLYPPLDKMIQKLEEAGYINLGEADKANGRTSLRKRNTVNYNLHVMKYLGKLWNNNILFRSYLREHQNAVSEYSKIKRNIVDKGIDTVSPYYHEKEEFILRIINIIENKAETNKQRIRGFQDGDDRFFSPQQICKLKTAQEELQFLLCRGYPVKSAGLYVGNHHQLTSRQILAVVRSTSSSQSLENRAKKRLSSENMMGQTVNIDGFNLIIGLEVALSNGMLFTGQDGCIRDLAELRGTYRLIPQTETAIQIIYDTLLKLKVAKVVFYLDEPVSNSGRLKSKIYDIDWRDIQCDVQIIRSPDAALKLLPCVVTSDSIILNECISWFNMIEYIFETRPEEFKSLSRLINLK
ncbi:MAG: DUF434 domain-containing protein [Oscillospiraceae bacterium]|nr:DUF434 domain-containing protein [Oscillospiraceae bacterium]